MQRKSFFTLTLFWSAMLLFMVQPLFARMALPLLGGAPSVWNIALVFFQFMLLMGYLYAHGLQRFAPRTQIVIHVTLLVTAALTLPLNIPGWYAEPSSSSPTLWLLGLLTVAVGLPFFALAAQAPLMQRWFSFSDDKDAKDPYFLYAASNIGSMIGLIGYPLAMEPSFGVRLQNFIWAGGFLGLILLVATAAAMTWKSSIKVPPVSSLSAPVPMSEQFMWILLSSIPSGLLVAVSNILATDIGSLPMLWVLPLIIYLLSFVIAFDRHDRLPIHKMPVHIAMALILAGIFAYSSFAENIWVGLLLLLLPFFIIATACHGRLVSKRPETSHMTRFYVLMSLGGAIGGGFSSLLAPVIFNWIYEFPILIAVAAAVLASPAVGTYKQSIVRRFLNGDTHSILGHIMAISFALVVAMIGSALVNKMQLEMSIPMPQMAGVFGCIGILVALCFMSRTLPFRFAATIAISGLVLHGFSQIMGNRHNLFQGRSFFGVNVVKILEAKKVAILQHGTTVHGAQSQLQALRYQPQSYYVADSGVGQVMRKLNFKNIGLVGLGSGGLSCYHRPGQSFTYFEIDPLMISIARNRKYFSFVSDCTPDARIILGDARLQLQRLATEPKFDLLIIDAFSSDSIPIHLITAEAMNLYLSRLPADGLLMVHISNRFFNLEPVVGRLAQNSGLHTAINRFTAPTNPPIGTYPASSIWIAASRDAALIEKVRGLGPGWKSLAIKPGQSLWTDDFSTPLLALKVLN
jgi:hypothetical protein